MNLLTLRRLSLLMLALVIVSGCGKKEETKTTTQVAATVNGEEITVSQVNSILSRTPGLSTEAAIKAKVEILEKLIDQNLAKQKSIETKIDRTPAVVQAIEASRNDILARAYLEKIAAALPKPSVQDVHKYYEEHPELFAQRRVYSLEELSVEPQNGQAIALGEQVAKSKTIQDIAVWLQSQNIKFTTNRGIRASEELPMELLPKLQALKDGDFQIIDDGGGRQRVLRVVASKLAPVTEAKASKRIEQFIFNKTASTAVGAEIKSLRTKADIAYRGEFVGGAAAAEAKAKAEAEAKAKADASSKAEEEAAEKARAELKAKTEADAAARAEVLAKARADAEAARKASEAKGRSIGKGDLRQEHIEKGLGGLK